jgi:segregation and condensation protein A
MSIAFCEDVRTTPRETSDGQFLLDLDGYEGPLDLLLQLARDKKIDLSRLSIAVLADQYVTYIEHVRHIRLETAADYLVMAAWLAYLKSRLLLPLTPDDQPSAEEQSENLAFQLRRLNAMREAGEALLTRPQKYSVFLPRGATSGGFSSNDTTSYSASLNQILQAYVSVCQKDSPSIQYDIPVLPLDSVEQALERLGALLGALPQWSELLQFLPAGLTQPLANRAAIAATFGASLELVKQGIIHLRQETAFGSIHVKGNHVAA